MKKLLLLMAATLVTSLSSAFGAFEEYLPGARAAGMGNAFAPIADDANATMANPAGLGWIEHQEFTSGYGRLYAGLWDGSSLATSFLGFVQPLHWNRRHLGTLGIGWVNFSLVQFYSEETLALAYGKEIGASWGVPGFYAGASIKSLRHTFRIGADPTASANPFFSAYGTSAGAVGADVGLLYRIRRKVSLSYNVRNLSRPDVGLKDKDPVSPSAEMGFAWHHLEGNLAFQVEHRGGLQILHSGAERWFWDNRIAARAGVLAGNRELKQGTLGFGLRTPSFSLDYAFRLPLSGIEFTRNTHRISFSVPFGSRLRKPLREGAEPLEAQEALFLREELRKTRALAKEREDRVRELEIALRELEAKTGVPAPVTYSTATLTAEQQTQEQLSLLRQEMANIRTTLERSRLEARSVQTRAQTLERALEPKTKKDPAKPQVYRARPGDSLQSLAEEFYGNANLWPKIYQANEDRIGRGGDLVPGQMLVIPPVEDQDKGKGEKDEP